MMHEERDNRQKGSRRTEFRAPNDGVVFGSSPYSRRSGTGYGTSDSGWNYGGGHYSGGDGETVPLHRRQGGTFPPPSASSVHDEYSPRLVEDALLRGNLRKRRRSPAGIIGAGVGGVLGMVSKPRIMLGLAGLAAAGILAFSSSLVSNAGAIDGEMIRSRMSRKLMKANQKRSTRSGNNGGGDSVKTDRAITTGAVAGAIASVLESGAELGPILAEAEPNKQQEEAFVANLGMQKREHARKMREEQRLQAVQSVEARRQQKQAARTKPQSQPRMTGAAIPAAVAVRQSSSASESVVVQPTNVQSQRSSGQHQQWSQGQHVSSEQMLREKVLSKSGISTAVFTSGVHKQQQQQAQSVDAQFLQQQVPQQQAQGVDVKLVQQKSQYTAGGQPVQGRQQLWKQMAAETLPQAETAAVSTNSQNQAYIPVQVPVQGREQLQQQMQPSDASRGLDVPWEVPSPPSNSVWDRLKGRKEVTPPIVGAEGGVVAELRAAPPADDAEVLPPLLPPDEPEIGTGPGEHPDHFINIPPPPNPFPAPEVPVQVQDEVVDSDGSDITASSTASSVAAADTSSTVDANDSDSTSSQKNRRVSVKTIRDNIANRVQSQASKFNSRVNSNSPPPQDQLIVVSTVATMALLVGALSARRLRSREFLSSCIENESLEDGLAYDTAYTQTAGGSGYGGLGGAGYDTFAGGDAGLMGGSWRGGNMEKFEV